LTANLEDDSWRTIRKLSRECGLERFIEIELLLLLLVQMISS
jgi:hypothetical protein